MQLLGALRVHADRRLKLRQLRRRWVAAGPPRAGEQEGLGCALQLGMVGLRKRTSSIQSQIALKLGLGLGLG